MALSPSLIHHIPLPRAQAAETTDRLANGLAEMYHELVEAKAHTSRRRTKKSMGSVHKDESWRPSQSSTIINHVTDKLCAEGTMVFQHTRTTHYKFPNNLHRITYLIINHRRTA